MKILFTTSSFAGGGITSYAHEVINNYTRNHELSVFVGDHSKSPIKNLNVKVFNIDCDDISYENISKSISLINNKIKPDLIINSNAALITIASPYINNDIRIISIAHSLKYTETTIAAFNQKYIDKIIALSDFAKENIIRKFNIQNRDKLVTIFNFVESIDSNREIRERKKINKTIKIVYPGGSSPAKTPEIVIKTIRKLLKTDLNFKFYWMGTRTPTLKKIQLFEDVSELFPDDERLIITGRLPREEATKLIADANILFTPSRREGFPMALLEGMRVGVISIVADYKNANKEIISNGYNGFVIKHDDIDAFVNVIEDIILNHKKYLSIYENNYNTYLSKLSFNIWKEKMDDVILNEDNFNHSKRKNKLNRCYYSLNLLKYKLISIKDSIQRAVNEYFKSGVSVFFIYLNRQFHCKKNKKEL